MQFHSLFHRPRHNSASDVALPFWPRSIAGWCADVTNLGCTGGAFSINFLMAKTGSTKWRRPTVHRQSVTEKHRFGPFQMLNFKFQNHRNVDVIFFKVYFVENHLRKNYSNPPKDYQFMKISVSDWLQTSVCLCYDDDEIQLTFWVVYLCKFDHLSDSCLVVSIHIWSTSWIAQCENSHL